MQQDFSARRRHEKRRHRESIYARGDLREVLSGTRFPEIAASDF